jgi:hypothetical protein
VPEPRHPTTSFHVKHSCGHYESYPHLVEPEEEARLGTPEKVLAAREEALIWKESRPCPTCYWDGSARAILHRLSDLGVPPVDLPRFTDATEKQRWWAHKIRAEKLQQIEERFRFIHADILRAERDPARRERARFAHRTYVQAIVAVVSTTAVTYWIDNRAISGWRLVMNAVPGWAKLP